MPATRRRTSTKLLPLFPEELADIAARAEACGLKPTPFITGVNCAAAGDQRQVSGGPNQLFPGPTAPPRP
jgi:hypothetical protein